METKTQTDEIHVMTREEMDRRWETVKQSGSPHSPEAESYRKAVGEQGDRLYLQFAKHLEKDHHGEFVAIHPSGETILAKKSTDLLEAIEERWGDEYCAMRRLGHQSFLEWKTPRC